MRISRCWPAALAMVVAAGAQQTLPGTKPLVLEGDPAAQMVEAIHQYLDRESALSREHRATQRSAAAQRERLRKIIGALDPRIPVHALQIDTASPASPEIATGAGYRVYAVRWGVFEDVEAEGLLLEPLGPVKARVVAIPDADWTPEMLVGMAPGVPPSAQFARRLAENGCEVLVPVLIDRSDTWSGIPGIRMTNQPHREWIYRMAFETGRTIIGYEVEKVLAAVDWFASTAPAAARGRGGLRRRRPARPLCGQPRPQDPGNPGERIFPTSRATVERADLPRCLGPAARIRRCGTGRHDRTAGAGRRGQRLPRGGRPSARRRGANRARRPLDRLPRLRWMRSVPRSSARARSSNRSTRPGIFSSP